MHSSYVPDISEAEDMSYITQETQSTFLCHNCLIAQGYFRGSRMCKKWTVLARQALLLDEEAGLRNAVGNGTELSMIAVPPVSHTFLIVRIYNFLEV